MIEKIVVPDIGENVESGKVVAVHIKAGDSLEVDDTVVELETDKAVVEIPSPFKGKVKEVLARFDLYRLVAPFSRCIRCNGILQAIDKQAIEERLEPKTRQYIDTFRICTACGQIYWQGSHHVRALRLIEELTK